MIATPAVDAIRAWFRRVRSTAHAIATGRATDPISESRQAPFCIRLPTILPRVPAARTGLVRQAPYGHDRLRLADRRPLVPQTLANGVRYCNSKSTFRRPE